MNDLTACQTNTVCKACAN